METLEKGLYFCILQNMLVATKAHQVLIAVGLDKRVVVQLVVNVALDSPGVSFHLQKQHILLIIFIRLTLRCWGNSSIPEGRFSKWF